MSHVRMFVKRNACCLGLVVLVSMISTTAGAQGEIWSWGDDVIVGASAVEDLVEVVHGLALVGLRSDGTLVSWGGSNAECAVPQPNAGYIDIAGNGNHCLGLRQDGSIVAWGANSHGQCDVPEPNDGFVLVGAGTNHSFGLKADGSLVAWGLNDEGQCEIPEPNAGFIAIAGGDHHSVGLQSDGSLVAWGLNADGQCDIPEPNAGFAKIYCRDNCCLGVKDDGSLVFWGYPGAAYHDRAELPELNEGFVEAMICRDSCFGLKDDGSIVAWGSSSYGSHDLPEPNEGFVALGSDGDYAIKAIRASGELVSWGQPNTQTWYVPFNEPNRDFVVVKSGWCDIALRSDGTIMAWGDDSLTQTLLPEGNDFIDIAGGDGRNFGLHADGTVSSHWVTYPYTGVIDISHIVEDGLYSISAFLALTDAGTIIVHTNGWVPDVPGENADFIAIATGYTHFMGLKSDGSIVAWGHNDLGQTDVPEPNTDFVAIACGRYFSLGLKADGSIVCWGDNSYGQCEVPEPNAGFMAVASGLNSDTSLGLLADGVMVAWGRNDHGQCDIPEPNGGWVDMSAYYGHVRAIRGQTTVSIENPHGSADDEDTPLVTRLQVANHPNPFNPMTEISYSLPAADHVTLGIYDLSGKLVRRLVAENRPAGVNTVVWDGRDERGMSQPSGVYLIQVATPSRTVQGRCTLVR